MNSADVEKLAGVGVAIMTFLTRFEKITSEMDKFLSEDVDSQLRKVQGARDRLTKSRTADHAERLTAELEGLNECLQHLRKLAELRRAEFPKFHAWATGRPAAVNCRFGVVDKAFDGEKVMAPLMQQNGAPIDLKEEINKATLRHRRDFEG